MSINIFIVCFIFSSICPIFVTLIKIVNGIKSVVYKYEKYIFCNPEDNPTDLFNFRNYYFNGKIRIFYNNIKKIINLSNNTFILNKYLDSLEDFRSGSTNNTFY